MGSTGESESSWWINVPPGEPWRQAVHQHNFHVSNPKVLDGLRWASEREAALEARLLRLRYWVAYR